MFITHRGFHWKENKDSSWKQCSYSSVMRESPVPVLNQLNFDSLYQDVCLIPFFNQQLITNNVAEISLVLSSTL